MAQQSQPSVPFNALKPATWGSLKLIPQALRSKLVGGKAIENVPPVAFGKENAFNPNAAPQAPPKIGDLSHLQSIGPRRTVNQKYALQPNLNVSRPALAPGLSGLLLPAAQQQQSLQQPPPPPQQQQQATSQQQRQSRPSTPSSPSLRGRQSLPNPNFVPSPGNIATRLPTPVRINASPGPSPSPGSNVALALPKPPSPSRSLSQGGVAPTNPFAYGSVCSSPAASTPGSSAFVLPTPPSILGNAPVNRTSQRGGPQAMPWASASGQGQSYNTPTSVRPSPPAPERSILASVQLPSQQQQRTASHNHTSITGAVPFSLSSASSFMEPHKQAQPTQQQQPSQRQSATATVAAAAAADAVVPGITVSPVITMPAIQAALQQALQAAMERKPETFKVDNFERMFDSMMHPGTATKLDGPLPDELPDDIRYGDNWYKHCREWNQQHKPCAPYIPPAGFQQPRAASQQAQIETVTMAATATPREQQQQEKEGQQPVSVSLSAADEQPMSEACCKALDIAHHGLRSVLTPLARSRGVSAAITPTSAQAAPSQQQLQQAFDQSQQQQQAAVEPEDAVVSRLDQARGMAADADVASTAAALASALEAVALEREADTVTAITPAASAACADGLLDLDLPQLAPQGSAGVAGQAAADLADVDMCTPRGPAVTGAAVGIRKVPRLAILIDGRDPRASLSESRSPAPDSARPPSTAATTPGPKTPGGDGGDGGAESVTTTAATTPVGRTATAANTPTTARGPRGSVFETAQLAPAEGVPEGTPGADVPASPLSQQLSAELPAAGPGPAGQQPAHGVTPVQQSTPPPAQSPALSDGGTLDSGVLWTPAFPPVANANAASMVRRATAADAAVPFRPPSPVTLLHSPPREMPTPNPAFFSSVAGNGGVSGLAAAVVAAVAAPERAIRDAAGPSTSSAPPPPDPLKEIVVGIEKLSTLKHNILAEDKEVDVASITQMIQLKLAVEQLLARTSTAAQAVANPTPAPAAVAASAAASSSVARASVAISAAEAAAGLPHDQHVTETPKKNSRSSGFGAFLKSVFSPRSGSASKAQPQEQFQQAAAPPSSVQRAFGTNLTAAVVNNNGSTAAAAAPQSVFVPASPATNAVGIKAARPLSTSAAPRSHVASPSLADRGRYAALHQKAAARLAEAAAEPAGPRAAAPSVNPSANGAGAASRGDLWRRYEEKIAVHRHQLDSTKAQLDEAVRKLNGMQAEFDELLLCLGMESAKNKALCDAMRAAGLDPEPILAAIEEQWMSGGGFPE